MEELTKKINSLKGTKIEELIKKRINEFKKTGNSTNNKIFKELCFCILTANFNAEKTIKIQNEIGNCFLNDSKEKISKKLKQLGHRFPNKRAEYISEAQKCKEKIKKVTQFHDEKKLRDWIVNNIKGIGYKEASHFLRNIGLENYAIIDFHIIDLLEKHSIIKKPKNLSKKKYLEIENILRKIAKKTNLTLAELDLYLWYIETGKILK